MTMTAQRTIPARVEHRRFGLARHSLALAKRSLIKTVRTPEQLLDVTLQPVIFVVLFVYLLGGAVAGSTHDYLQTLLPAIMVQTTLFGGMATGVNLNTDIGKGVFDRFRSLPIGRSAPLIGSVLGDLIRYVVAVVSLLVFGSILGFRVETGFLPALAACLLVILFAFSLSWAFVLVGMLVREPGAVQGIAFLVLFPLTFGTSMIAPADTLPSWLRSWVEVNPITHVMDAARGLMIGGPVAGPVLWTLLWSAVFVVVFAPLAVRAYRRRA
ncbi:ABC transporter permease [Actinosynnema sp. NPDC047251]|uniref:Transport permease protein n=1 Tax=Saccharothrix espanaensis (strain ATCC 51144 / DSM 44229 / JCM 9112 / NBRC 15066 / NRRL 15764) TaxID=1179773 RepID=K0JUB6_SACES|nr:ABC transporter permease [Saccharothrix espanaensis]CCH31435.1 ABC-type transporter [Saccharothrix espanaensis DSM 44229]